MGDGVEAEPGNDDRREIFKVPPVPNPVPILSARLALSELEQLWCELNQVVAPVGPGMTPGRFLIDHIEAVLLQSRHSGPGCFDQEILFAGAEPNQLQRRAFIDAYMRGTITLSASLLLDGVSTTGLQIFRLTGNKLCCNTL
jgi:hypothetical protein